MKWYRADSPSEAIVVPKIVIHEVRNGGLMAVWRCHQALILAQLVHRQPVDDPGGWADPVEPPPTSRHLHEGNSLSILQVSAQAQSVHKLIGIACRRGFPRTS